MVRMCIQHLNTLNLCNLGSYLLIQKIHVTRVRTFTTKEILVLHTLALDQYFSLSFKALIYNTVK